MHNLLTSQKPFARLILALAAAPLCAAFISQYFFNMHPCELCIFQRIPYAVIMFFALLSARITSDRLFISSAIISIHAFLINAGIAFYHVGVEKHWWKNEGCSSNLNMNSLEDLKASIMATKAVRCDEVQFEFLTISMAGWNFVYSLAAGIFIIYALVKYIRFKRTQAVNNA